MKKSVIAFMLSLAMAVVSIGGTSALAAEPASVEEEAATEAVDENATVEDKAAAESADADAAVEEEAAAEAVDEDAAVEEEAVTKEADEVTVVTEEDERTEETTGQEESDEISEAVEPVQSEADREALSDIADEENVAQAIWTQWNSTLYFYYGPQVYEDDYFMGETVTGVWSGTDVTESKWEPAWSSWEVQHNVATVLFDSSFLEVKPTSTCRWFYGFSILRFLDLSGLDTSEVKDMSYMFSGCSFLQDVDLSGLNTSQVTNMSNMFSSCVYLESLDLSGFDTSHVEKMSSMFDGCMNLTDIDLSGFDTSSVIFMDSMFSLCSKLESIDLSGFNTSKVLNFLNMFSECSSLTVLDISGFDVSNVGNISAMFYRCSSLQTIFCPESTTDWSSSIAGADVFTGCTSLVGVEGEDRVAYDSTQTTVSMAKAAGLGGYFTPKASIADYDIELSASIMVYSGEAKMPTVVVSDDSRELIEQQDYEVRFEDNIEPGTATVTITGIGSYTGTVTRTFRIVVGKTTRGDMFNLANNVKVTWKEVPGAKYYKVYRSGLNDPVIVTSGLVGWDKEPGLVNGRKYTYKIVASTTGKGDDSGDSPYSYSKVMYRLKTVVIRSVKNTAPGKVTVKYDKTTAGDSYVLQYSEREDMVGAKTKVVLGAANTSYVISGLKKGKTYYISIRVRKKVNGIDYYTTFGVPKKVKVVK